MWCDGWEAHRDMCSSTTISDDSLIKHLRDIQIYGNTSVLADEFQIRILSSVLKDLHGICYVEDSTKYAFYTAISTVYNHFFEPYNRMLLLMTEVGLIEKLLLDYSRNYSSYLDSHIVNNFSTHQISSPQTYFILQVSHLQVIFYLYILGLCFAFVVFIAEFIYICTNQGDYLRDPKSDVNSIK